MKDIVLKENNMRQRIKVGDLVEVIDTKALGWSGHYHLFDIGEVVQVIRKLGTDDDCSYLCRNKDCIEQVLLEHHFKPVEENLMRKINREIAKHLIGIYDSCGRETCTVAFPTVNLDNIETIRSLANGERIVVLWLMPLLTIV